MRKLTILILIIATLAMVSCVTQDYSAFKDSRPRSILVMPPVNQTVDITAPLTFISTATYPLAESGYYVIPVTLSSQTFIQNGVTIAEEAHQIPHARLRQIFGADAALYITITNYGSNVNLLHGRARVLVTAEAKLVDLRTGVEIWTHKIYEEDSGQRVNTSGFGLLGFVATVAVNQVINVVTDRAFDVGKKANNTLLSANSYNGILYGPYHPKYDGE
ncbi:MAG: DUF799 domain-containing protein [Treponema sp.]|jgi:hypothetical protein|nr:DUF799 domain-containing protein [Treponema sp.]